jgi:CRISPR-associated protein Cas5d
VHYRLHADLEVIPERAGGDHPGKYLAMFERRASKGQCVNQPYLGSREFAADFRLASADDDPPPLAEDRDLGWMLYDLDYSDPNDPAPRFFNARMVQGMIRLPE